MRVMAAEAPKEQRVGHVPMVRVHMDPRLGLESVVSGLYEHQIPLKLYFPLEELIGFV